MDKKYYTNFQTILIKISIEDLGQLLHRQNRVKMIFKFPNNIFGKFEHNICSEFEAREFFT